MIIGLYCVAGAMITFLCTVNRSIQDGNGRVARALASILLLKGNLSPMVVLKSDREAYLHKLEQVCYLPQFSSFFSFFLLHFLLSLDSFYAG